MGRLPAGAAGKFVPAGFEVSFQAAENLRTVNISLGETERMRLKGRIDRIDLCCEEDRVYVKVVDYKSGSTSFDLRPFMMDSSFSWWYI